LDLHYKTDFITFLERANNRFRKIEKRKTKKRAKQCCCEALRHFQSRQSLFDKHQGRYFFAEESEVIEETEPSKVQVSTGSSSPKTKLELVGCRK
jgi:hypothetical protein